jgi:hypothetical protein
MKALHSIIHIPHLSEKQMALLGKELRTHRETRVRTTPIKQYVVLESKRTDYWDYTMTWQEIPDEYWAMTTRTRATNVAFFKANKHQVTFVTGRK